MSRRLGLCLLLLASLPAAGQTVDAAVGIGAVASGGSNGGAWPSFSVTGMFTPVIGIGGEWARRTPHAAGNDPFPPVLVDLNLVLRAAPRTWEVQLGYAWEHAVPSPTCANGLLLCATGPEQWLHGPHLGISVKPIRIRRAFVRIAYHLTALPGNLGPASRLALSLGYTFGGAG